MKNFLAFSFLAAISIPSIAYDNVYQIQTNPYGNPYGNAANQTTEIEMRRRNDFDPSNRFRGEIETDGTVRMRNLNGDRLRGEIDSDGYGRLRDQDGNTYRVRPR